MSKKIKDHSESCLYLSREIEFVTAEILKLVGKIETLYEKRSHLNDLLAQMLCPEDTSPEAIMKNQKLAAELKREFWPQDFIK
jgi:hypothetical protein